MVRKFPLNKLISVKKDFKTSKYDGLILAMLGFIIVCSFIFSVHNNGSYVPILGGMRIPNSCFFKYSTGHNCPTCGMTRSFISIGHGDFYESIKYNLGGIFAYMLCVSFIIFQAVKIRTRSTSKILPYIWVVIKVQTVITALTILFGWIYFW